MTDKISIPVSFSWHIPDPVWTAWWKEDKKLRQQKVPKQQRPPEPQRSPKYPKKYELALQLLQQFRIGFPNFSVIAVLADALYGNRVFVDGVQRIWPEVQVITQLRKNQIVRLQEKSYSCEQYFEKYKGWEQKIIIRGRKTQDVCAGGARLYVPSHDTKRFVIALKYGGEKEYRYLLASDLSWNMRTVMQAYTVRWLVEVFFEDWSCYGGFCSLAKQCGVEGSKRPLILSLLFDHCFLLHEQQQTFIKHRLPLATFGSLLEKTRMEALLRFVQRAVEGAEKENCSKRGWEEVMKQIGEAFEIRPSKKHFSGINIDLESMIHQTASNAKVAP